MSDAGLSVQAQANAIAVEELQKRFLWRQERGQWWVKRENGIWTAEEVEEVQTAIKGVIIERWPDKLSASLLGGVKSLLRSDLAVSPLQFDRDPWLLGVKNGIVDLEYGKLLGGDVEHYITRSCDAAFDPDAQCPKWEAHVLRLFKGDEEMAHTFQKFIGASLVGDAETVKPQGFGQLLGPSGGGKGTTTRVLGRVFGSYSGTFRSEDFAAGRSRHTQWMVRLNGIRLAVVQEMPTDALNVALLKTLSGGDPQVANEMRMNDAQWVPTHTLLFTSNNAPNFGVDPDGFYRRYIPFQTAERDTGVKSSGSYEAELREEAAGILAWAIEGTQLWLDEDDGDDIALPQSIVDQRDSHISGQNPAEEFVKDWFSFGDDTAQSCGYYRCHRSEVRERFSWVMTGCTNVRPVELVEANDVRLRKVYDVLDAQARAGQPMIGNRQSRGWFGAHLVDEDEHWARTNQ
jgi:P4 family phage/plasmid primase-like protien